MAIAENSLRRGFGKFIPGVLIVLAGGLLLTDSFGFVDRGFWNTLWNL